MMLFFIYFLEGFLCMASRKILFSESVLERILKENSEDKFYPETGKVLAVKKYLDKAFIRTTVSDIDNNGYPVQRRMAGMLGNNGEVVNTLSPKQLFYLIQDRFKNIYSNKEQRDRLLRQVVKDWMNEKLKDDGTLTTNSY